MHKVDPTAKALVFSQYRWVGGRGRVRSVTGFHAPPFQVRDAPSPPPRSECTLPRFHIRNAPSPFCIWNTPSPLHIWNAPSPLPHLEALSPLSTRPHSLHQSAQLCSSAHSAALTSQTRFDPRPTHPYCSFPRLA
eukprot:184959-Chlamydomonas_euryale.AAC.4